MADDDRELDDLVRGALRGLDAQVPADYFDTLAERTLARLDAAPDVVPEVVPDEDADSGLHDIRSLATSQRLRISARRSSQNLIPSSTEDVLAASSAGWRAVALPTAAPVEPPSAAAVAPVPLASHGSRGARARTHAGPRRGPTRGRVLVVAGLVLVAAAGVALFLAARREAPAPGPLTTAPTPPPREQPAVAPPRLEVTPIEPPVAPPVEPVRNPDAEPGPVPETAPDPAPAPQPKKSLPTKTKPAPKTVKSRKPEPPMMQELRNAAPAPTPQGKQPSRPPANAAPETDEIKKLLDGPTAAPAPQKAALDRTSLSAADIKRGMQAVSDRARACYAGTAGTASLRLTVAASGQVQKVAVSGPFAGTPVAACVEAAVRGAAFPAWDGGPQSFGYSYLLSE